jgi:hypothetical protein
MSDIYWLNAVSGNFATPGDWSGGAAPGPSDTAILDADGNAYTVLFNGDQNYQVQSLQLSSNATLEITVAGFIAGTIVNAGTILIHSDLVATNVLNNSGMISISGGLNLGTLIIYLGCTLTGSGTVKIGGKGAEIGGSQSGLVNTDNTISGSGKILLEAFVNDAAGKIDEAGPNRLTIATAKNTIMNAGMIESSGAGGILIRSPIANDGTVTVDRGIFTFEGPVSGSGEAVIGGGTLDFQSSFSEAVTFIAGGTLELAQSEAYSGTVTGFSKKGKTTLDLTDIRTPRKTPGAEGVWLIHSL